MDPDEDFEDDELDPVDEVDDEDPELDPDEPEEDVEPEEDDEPPPARQPTRGENRVAAATRAAKEAKAEAALARQELALLRQQQQQPRGETQAQVNERLAQMEPWERTEYLTTQRLNQIEWNANERADKAAFKMVCMSDPVASRMESEVEARLTQMRASGQTVDRETLYTFMLGERAKANKGRATGKAQRTATANRERQQARPSNSRGDATPGDRRSRNADTPEGRAKRLESSTI